MTLKATLAAIEEWFEQNAPKAREVLQPGASPEAIAKLEATVGAPLPADLRELLALHDGQKPRVFVSTIAAFTLLSCKQAAEVWQENGELLDAGDFEGQKAVSKDGTVKGEWWSKKWIPFAESAGGDFLCVDLDPGPSGKAGQVLRFWHDEEWRDALAPSVEALLEQFLAGLRKGEYKVGGTGGIQLA
jgi:cell wall assembly regulator SMI1